MFDRGTVEQLLVETNGTVDVGLMDPHVITVSVEVTPQYATWLEVNGCDVDVMQPVMGAYSSYAPGKHAVQLLINQSLGIVSNLIDAGVPEEVALRLLPHELYVLMTQQHPQF